MEKFQRVQQKEDLRTNSAQPTGARVHRAARLCSSRNEATREGNSLNEGDYNRLPVRRTEERG